MTPRLDGEMLYVSAPDLHFLTGKPLDRLKDGRTVTFIAQLSLSLDDNRTDSAAPSAALRLQLRRLGSGQVLGHQAGRRPPRKGLSAAAAEAWCLESLAINTSGIAPDRPVGCGSTCASRI